jgi:hypothetical protein
VKEGFVLGLTAVSSVGLYLLGRRALGLPAGTLGAAAGRTLEWLGLVVLVFAGNLALGLLAILSARVLTGGFVSLYLAGDVTLLVLSLLQALLLAAWREQSRAGDRRPPR